MRSSNGLKQNSLIVSFAVPPVLSEQQKGMLMVDDRLCSWDFNLFFGGG